MLKPETVPYSGMMGTPLPRRKGVRKRGVFGVKNPLELDIFKNFTTCTKEIDCFRILLAC